MRGKLGKVGEWLKCLSPSIHAVLLVFSDSCGIRLERVSKPLPSATRSLQVAMNLSSRSG